MLCIWWRRFGAGSVGAESIEGGRASAGDLGRSSGRRQSPKQTAPLPLSTCTSVPRAADRVRCSLGRQRREEGGPCEGGTDRVAGDRYGNRSLLGRQEASVLPKWAGMAPSSKASAAIRVEISETQGAATCAEQPETEAASAALIKRVTRERGRGRQRAGSPLQSHDIKRYSVVRAVREK